VSGRVGDDDRDVAHLVAALRVPVGFGNLAQGVGAPDDVAQRSSFDQLPEEHEIGGHRCSADEVIDHTTRDFADGDSRRCG